MDCVVLLCGIALWYWSSSVAYVRLVPSVDGAVCQISSWHTTEDPQGQNILQAQNFSPRTSLCLGSICWFYFPKIGLPPCYLTWGYSLVPSWPACGLPWPVFSAKKCPETTYPLIFSTVQCSKNILAIQWKEERQGGVAKDSWFLGYWLGLKVTRELFSE